MDMSDYAAPIEKEGDGGPTAVVFIEPPNSAQRFQSGSIATGNSKPELAGLSFHIGQTQRLR